MAKGYGKKVKRSKNIYKRRKTNLRIAVEIAITIVIATALGVVGYSAGKPLLEFLSSGGQSVETGVSENPVESDETVESEERDDPVESHTQQTTVQTTTAAEVKTEEPGKIAYTPNNALQNSSALSAYVLQLKADGYNTSVIELKDISGNLWYKSGIDGVKDAELIKGGLTLNQIKAVFDNAGVAVIAKIITLQDPSAPVIIGDISYRAQGGSYRWYDDAPERGGKLWANPFLDGTKKYLSDIVGEISDAGFTGIILSAVQFPRLTPYDLTLLPQNVIDTNNRYTALVDVFNACASRNRNGKLYIESSVLDLAENYAGFQKTAEIFRGKNSLGDVAVLVTMNRSDIGSELHTGANSTVSLPTDAAALVTAIFKQAARNISPLAVIPCINGADFTNTELEAVKKAFDEMGYSEYVIR